MMNEVAPDSGGTAVYAEQTMLWGLELAKPLALAWHADAKYVGCVSPSVFASGLGEWWYIFNSVTDPTILFAVKIPDKNNITTETASGYFPYNIGSTYFSTNSDVWMKWISDPGFKAGNMYIPQTYYTLNAGTVLDVYYSLNSTSITTYGYNIHVYPIFNIEKVSK